jgi:glucosamine-6-phosphate deaminase
VDLVVAVLDTAAGGQHGVGDASVGCGGDHSGEYRDAGVGGDPAAVPARAITLGLAEILAARRILLVVTGAAKAPVLRALLRQPPGVELPASWLQGHPQVEVIADRAALALAEQPA